jgi:Predicted membrane protein
MPWRLILRRAARSFSAHSCTDLAAGLTYFAVLSSVPALLALVSLLGLVGQRRSGSRALLQVLDTIAPASVQPMLHTLVKQIVASPAVGWAIVIGIVGAVWTASGYVGAFGRAINRIYGVPEGRSALRLRPWQLLITVALLVLVVVVLLVLVLSGPIASAVGRAVGLGSGVLNVWSVVKWPVLAVAVIAAVGMLYWATPNLRRSGFRGLGYGATAAVVVLVVASLGFGLYVSNFGHYDRTYGTLGGLVVLLLWLWITNIALLLGAELDAEIERARQLRRGLASEEHLQLPLRATRASDKASAKHDRDVRDSRAVREAARSFQPEPEPEPED